MNKHLGKDTPIVTIGDVEEWQTERAKKVHQREAIDADIALLDKKIEAARILAGIDMPGRVYISDPTPNDFGPESMEDASKRILAGFSRPVLHHELQAELRKTERFREMLDKNGGAYYYTMLNRLVKRVEVKKVGKKIRLIRKEEAPSEGNPESASKATTEG